MTENKPHAEPGAPEIIHKSRGIPTVWLVPLVAAVIGGWLWVKHIREAGIPIEISFDTASGIEAGKTKIKHKDIQVGLVDSVDFADDLSSVTISATMERPAGPHLLENAKFWVVQTRIGRGGISGLDTLISGAYINMRLGDGAPTTSFVGLEEPPGADANVKGVRLVLKAEDLGSLGPGVQVYFRDIPAGEVERTDLQADGTGVEVHVIVKAPYDKYVRSTSHFWNASAVNVSFDSGGITIAAESIARILGGGLAFDSPADQGEQAKDGDVFQIHKSFIEATERIQPERGPFYVLYPPGATRGLQVGAPVSLEGVTIGDVIEVKMQYDAAYGIRTRVRVRLEPTNIHGVLPDDADSVSSMMDDLVERGLRAQLKTISLLTGGLYVDLGFHPDEPAQLVGDSELPELPTIPSPLESLERKADQFLDQLASLPLKELIEDTRATINTLKDTIENLNGKIDPLVDGIDGATAQAQKTMATASDAIATIEAGLAPGSPMYFDLATALEELSAAARSLRLLSAFLERNPNALIRGKSKQ
jgi:paraquat-inducible protein B